jgi:hypothetical protein
MALGLNPNWKGHKNFNIRYFVIIFRGLESTLANFIPSKLWQQSVYGLDTLFELNLSCLFPGIGHFGDLCQNVLLIW